MPEKSRNRPGRPRKTEANPQLAAGGRGEPTLVSSLSKALRILTLFTLEHPDWSAAELAAKTGLQRASVYRILRTMEQEAFVGVDPATGRYHLGPAVYPTAYLTQTNSELVRIARPHLRTLAERTGETANLAVDVDGWPVVVDQVLTAQIYKPVLPFGKAIGDIRSSHAKLFLAFKSEKERRKRIAADQRSAEAGETAVEDLIRELDTIVDQGVAYDIESLPGVCAISVPVYDHSGSVRASISVVAPPERFGIDEMTKCVGLARVEAVALSQDLGHVA